MANSTLLRGRVAGCCCGNSVSQRYDLHGFLLFDQLTSHLVCDQAAKSTSHQDDMGPFVARYGFHPDNEPPYPQSSCMAPVRLLIQVLANRRTVDLCLILEPNPDRTEHYHPLDARRRTDARFRLAEFPPKRTFAAETPHGVIVSPIARLSIR